MESTDLRIYPSALMAIVPGDITSAGLAEALAPYRLCFPPDPLDPEQTMASLLAANRGGRRRLRYGTIASYLRGVTIVNRQGRVLEVGGQTVKNVTGYALPQLVAGAGHDFGDVSSLTLTLRPLPPARRAFLLGFAQPQEAAAAAAIVLREGSQPNCLALLDATSQEQSGLALEDGTVGALLLAEYDGHSAALDRQADRLLQIVGGYGGRIIAMHGDEAGIRACWRPWEALECWLNSGPVGTLSIDLSLPRSNLASFIERAQSIARAYRLRLLIWGDAGVGNLHPTLCWNPADAWRQAEAYQAALLLWQFAVTLDGTAAGERGNATLEGALERGADPIVVSLRSRLAAALNPG